jgi:hypothetical protein
MEGRRESKESGMWGGNRGHPDAPEILVATPAIAMILTAKKTKSARECPYGEDMMACMAPRCAKVGLHTLAWVG